MTTLMTERNMMGMAGMEMKGSAAASPAAANMMMVPRCKVTAEKCKGGMKLNCVCEDQTSARMLQNLCAMMAGGMCSCCMMMNGMTVCCCNLTMGMCNCEVTDMGVCFTCTSGDKDCCDMIQACCDCCARMMTAGCKCCVMMNGMPVCCAV
jgi:hypothetical protein